MIRVTSYISTIPSGVLSVNSFRQPYKGLGNQGKSLSREPLNPVMHNSLAGCKAQVLQPCKELYSSSCVNVNEREE